MDRDDDRFPSERHSDRAHAVYAPSSMKRTLNCPGWLSASVGEPEQASSLAAEEGTECHEAAAAILTDTDYPFDSLSEDQERIVDDYTNYCLDLTERMITKYGKENVKVWIEQRVRSDVEGLENNHGTADFVIFVKPLRTVAIVDLKAGFFPVEVGTAENPNPQLANYGFLTLDHHKLWSQVDDVRLTIVQPRVYSRPQTLILPKARLKEFAYEVEDAIAAIEGGDLKRAAGEWCKFCPALGKCPTARSRVTAAAKNAFGEIHPRNIPAEELIAVLNEARLIAAHYEAVMQHVSRELEKGRLHGMGWKNVEKRATAKWIEGEKLENFRDKLYADHDVFAYKAKPLTPLQLIAALKKAKIDIDISEYFVSESSGLTLVPADDPRPEKKSDVFGDK